MGRRWEPTGDVTGFDADWYLEQNPNLSRPFSNWFDDRTGKLHFLDYVKGNPGLDAAWRSGLLIGNMSPVRDRTTDPATLAAWQDGAGHGYSRWDWGAYHYNMMGNGGEPGKFQPLIVGGEGTLTGDRGTMDWIDVRDRDHAQDRWLMRHYDTYGRDAGLFGSEMEQWNSPENQQAILDEQRAWDEKQAEDQRAWDAEQADLTRQWEADMLASQTAHQDRLRAEQEKMNQRMSMVRSSGTSGVGGNADFRGSRLTTTTGGGRSGPGRFSRVTAPLFMNPLGGLGGNTVAQTKNTVKL